MKALIRSSDAGRIMLALAGLMLIAMLMAFLFKATPAKKNHTPPAAVETSRDAVIASADVLKTADVSVVQTKDDRNTADSSRTESPASMTLVKTNFAEQAGLALMQTNVIARSMDFGRIMTAWVARDPEGVTIFLRGMPRGNEFVAGLLILIKALAESDPRHAVELALELAVHPEEMHVFNVLFDQLARRDIAVAASYLPMLPPGEQMDNAVRAIASRWVDADEAAALAWATSMRESEVRHAAVESVLFPMISTDPWRALRIAAQHLQGDALERTITRFLAEVTVKDAAGAEQVLAFLPGGETRSHAILGMARELAAQDPETAVSWTFGIEDESLRQTALRNVIEKWYAQDPAGARDYVTGSLSGRDQVETVSRIAEFWAVEDPYAAIAWAAKLPSEDSRIAANVSIASGWARRDPVAATTWAVELPVLEKSRAEAIDGALSFWVLIDAAGAAEYAERLPVGVNRDTCLDALATLMAVSHTERASQLALQILDPDLRAAAVRSLADVWRYNDPVRADEVLRRIEPLP